MYGSPARILTPNVKSPDCLSLFHIVDEFLVRCCTVWDAPTKPFWQALDIQPTSFLARLYLSACLRRWHASDPQPCMLCALLQLSEQTGPALGISWADNNSCNATEAA
jgi:hypothetical protein